MTRRFEGVRTYWYWMSMAAFCVGGMQASKLVGWDWTAIRRGREVLHFIFFYGSDLDGMAW
jgi:hypothetical protein